MILQLSLFGDHVHVVPTDTPTDTDGVYGWQVGPAAIDRCHCGTRNVYPVLIERRYGEDKWNLRPCCEYLCESCDDFSEDFCGTCESCLDCCECNYCESCSDMFSHDPCRHCEHCRDCCSCVECIRCDRLADEDCLEGVHCDYHCDCTSCECDDCTGNTTNLDDYGDSVDLDGIPGTHIGVEIEFVGVDATERSGRETIMEALTANGIDVAYTSDHDETSLRRWTLKPDGSVYGGGELVSPPLDWTTVAARSELRSALSALSSIGCKPSDATGIHVHVEAKNSDGEKLSVEQLQRLVRIVAANEDMIYRIAASDTGMIRSGARTYAMPLDSDKVERMCNATNLTGIIQSMWSRYHGFNVQSFVKHDTIEFRYCNSTLFADRLIAQVSMFYALMQAAKDSDNANVPEIGDGYSVGAAYGGRADTEDELRYLERSIGNYVSESDWNTLVAYGVNCSAPQVCRPI